MATVVDSLIVTLGLDPSGFSKGSKQAAQDLLKTKENFRSTGKDIESSGKNAAQFFSQLTGRVMMLFAAFASGRGVKQFVDDLTRGNAAAGRMATVLVTTTEELSKWRGMATAMGGSADGVVGSINTLTQSLEELSLTGESSILPALRALQAYNEEKNLGANLSLEGKDGKTRSAIDMLPELNKAVQGMKASTAANLLGKLGLGQDMINILLQDEKTFKRMMADQVRLGLVTKEQAAAAARLQTSNAGVAQSFETLGRIIMTDLEPAIVRMNKKLEDLFVWFQNNPEKLKKAFYGIAAAVVALGLAFGGPLIWIPLVATALTKLYDDWEQWNTTGKSDFGEFWEFVRDGWKDIGDSITDTSKKFQQWAVDTLGFDPKPFNDAQNEMGEAAAMNADGTAKSWKEMGDGFRKWWKETWDWAGSTISDAAASIMRGFKISFGPPFKWVMDNANMIWKAITGNDLFKGHKQSDELTVAPDVVVGGTQSAPPASGSGAAAPSNAKLFIEKYRPVAEKISAETGVPADRILAQAGLESGWKIDAPGNNFFGVKAQQGYGGKTQILQTTEDFGSGLVSVPQTFRKYDTAEEGWRDWAKVLDQKNFKAAKNPNLTDAQYAQALKDGGYATDKDYAAKLSATIAMTKRQLATDTLNATAPTPAPQQVPGATGTATVASAANDNRRSTSNSNATNINKIEVVTQSNDANGLAKDLDSALKERFMSDQSNYGQL